MQRTSLLGTGNWEPFRTKVLSNPQTCRRARVRARVCVLTLLAFVPGDFCLGYSSIPSLLRNSYQPFVKCSLTHLSSQQEEIALSSALP